SMLASIDSDAPALFPDTGPATVLEALQDPSVAGASDQLILNVDAMHTLAFRLSGTRILGFYEHHTALLDQIEIERLTERFISGTLTHEEVFSQHGHGVYYVDAIPVQFPLLAVTGSQRDKLRGSRLHAHVPAPHGDVMISGCYGLVQAFAGRFLNNRQEIESALTT
ncbi:MAG: DUF1786 family protein, partial [Dehalococcoidia bacterium]